MFLLLATACSDYGLNGMEDAGEGGDSAQPARMACEQLDLDWHWQGSELLYERDAMPSEGFSAITLPDVDGAPAGTDRAYLSVVELVEVPDRLYVDLQSDDGVWLWIDGVEVGHWGGDWQQEGCVNENAECVERVEVPPVDIAGWLQPGENRIEARVSNAILGHYFDLVPHCG